MNCEDLWVLENCLADKYGIFEAASSHLNSDREMLHGVHEAFWLVTHTSLEVAVPYGNPSQHLMILTSSYFKGKKDFCLAYGSTC